MRKVIVLLIIVIALGCSTNIHKPKVSKSQKDRNYYKQNNNKRMFHHNLKKMNR